MVKQSRRTFTPAFTGTDDAKRLTAAVLRTVFRTRKPTRETTLNDAVRRFLRTPAWAAIEAQLNIVIMRVGECLELESSREERQRAGDILDELESAQKHLMKAFRGIGPTISPSLYAGAWPDNRDGVPIDKALLADLSLAISLTEVCTSRLIEGDCFFQLDTHLRALLKMLDLNVSREEVYYLMGSSLSSKIELSNEQVKKRVQRAHPFRSIVNGQVTR